MLERCGATCLQQPVTFWKGKGAVKSWAVLLGIKTVKRKVVCFNIRRVSPVFCIQPVCPRLGDIMMDTLEEPQSCAGRRSLDRWRQLRASVDYFLVASLTSE